MERNRQNMNLVKRMKMNRITAVQCCAHIAEDDFFRRFGNPVFIINGEEPVIVCMAWEYYERLLSQIPAEEDPAE